MIRISGSSMDGITLGKTFREIIEVALGSARYHFEFSKKYRSSLDAPLITIAVRNVQAFQLNDKVITYGGIYQWLQDNDALIEVNGDSIFYIIPKYNLELSVDVDDIGFSEVLLYADSEKEERERDLLPYAEFMALKRSEIPFERVEFKPFLSVGCYDFGIPLEIFSIRHRIDSAFHNTDGKVYVWVDKIGFRFDDNRLTQIHLGERGKKARGGSRSVLLKHHSLMEKATIDSLLGSEDVIERGDNLYLFRSLGFAVDKEQTKFYFFDKALLADWENEDFSPSLKACSK